MYLGKKSPKFFPAGPFFLVLQLNVYRSTLILRNLTCPEKFLVTCLFTQTLQKIQELQAFAFPSKPLIMNIGVKSKEGSSLKPTGIFAILLSQDGFESNPPKRES